MQDALRAAILAACDAVEAAREALCELDAQTGDGDHGVTMTIGARGVRSQLADLASDAPLAIVRVTAMGMAGAGGTIGPLYGRGLLAVADYIEGALQEEPGANDSHTVDDAGLVRILAGCAAAANSATAALGRASPGDKTVLDALDPVARALATAGRNGTSLVDALAEARASARAGAEATVGMVAAVGRSARFGQRSRGAADPGASSFAVIVDAMVASYLDASHAVGTRDVQDRALGVDHGGQPDTRVAAADD